MIHLTVDAGNSQLALVVYRQEERLAGKRVRTKPHPTPQELVEQWSAVLSELGILAGDVHLTISSVVPQLEESLKAAAESFDPLAFHWVNWRSPHGFKASESAKKEIGADLIAGLVGAREFVNTPLTVVDCGTATTLTLVDESNHILGVAILPGLVTQLHSLTQSAPHLPQDISLRPPTAPYGNDTEEALQSGILYGHAAGIEGFIARYQALFPHKKLTSLACGGLFHRISSLCPSIEIEEVELVNIGCRVLAREVKRQLQEGL